MNLLVNVDMIVVRGKGKGLEPFLLGFLPFLAFDVRSLCGTECWNRSEWAEKGRRRHFATMATFGCAKSIVRNVRAS